MTLFDKRGDAPGDGGGCDSNPISCEEALRLVHDFLDGELDGVTPAEVKAHFEVCQACYPHLRLEQAFRDAMRRACARECAPPALREKVERLLSETGSLPE